MKYIVLLLSPEQFILENFNICIMQQRLKNIRWMLQKTNKLQIKIDQNKEIVNVVNTN